MIVSSMNEYVQNLTASAIGIVHLFRLADNTFSAEVITGFLNDMNKKLPNSLDMYFSNNISWNQPGGFAAFSGSWTPDQNWDNTKRPWFIDAKKNEGRIAFSEPYVDSDTDDIIVTLSMTVFDGDIDIGVIANDITVNVLGDIVSSMRSYCGQEIYIINADGLFITHDDINTIMNKDFFNMMNIERHRTSILETPDLFIIDRFNFIYSSAIPDSDWIVVSVIPASVIFAETNMFIIYLIIFTLVMFICVATVTIVFARRKITVPLTNVLEMTKSLMSKDFNANIKDFSNDEIGDIQLALLKIRDKLKSGIDSLHDHLSDNDNKK